MDLAALKAQITEALADAIAPIAERIDELERRTRPGPVDQPGDLALFEPSPAPRANGATRR